MDYNSAYITRGLSELTQAMNRIANAMEKQSRVDAILGFHSRSIPKVDKEVCKKDLKKLLDYP